MQPNLKEIQYLTGNEVLLKNLVITPVHQMFAERTIDFLGALSRELLADKNVKNYVDVLSYAFWIRKKAIEKVRDTYQNIECRIGRGVAFHIAPSNVPVNFAVSFTSALLAGNACIVRISNKEFEQVDIIVKALKKLFESSYKDMEQYLCLIRYNHDDDITQFLSSICDVRIIWGGNKTIEIVRRAKLPPRAIEMAFADRYSLAVINADKYLQMDSEKVAKKFFTDTYYTDQNACSSPRLVIWTGKNITQAKERFWNELQNLVRSEYELHPINVIDKLVMFCKAASENPNIRVIRKDNYIVRIKLAELNAGIMEYKEGGGYFFEYETEDLSEIAQILQKKCQTISYLGIDELKLKEIVYQTGPRGVDRIVPMGQTMELSFRWDGYDMIETMSRLIDVK
ncbi:MAG: acyl-CoA reductase [Lachnospiraceae bacterium]